MRVEETRVLIINATYEPMGTIPVKQAMKKLSNPEMRLEVIAWDDNLLINSSKDEWPVPSIMKLQYYVPLRSKRDKSQSKRGRIYQRDKWRCQYCLTKMGKIHPLTRKKLTEKELTLDHIHPKSLGGETKPSNLVTACKPCNQLKADRTPSDARMHLHASETILKADLDRIALIEMARRNPTWRKYLFLDNAGDDKHQHIGDESTL